MPSWNGIAVWLLNYGGPRNGAEAEPFLRELFGDPFIFNYPKWFWGPVSAYIARKRAPKLVSIYGEMGGFSPIWEGTARQAEALGQALGEDYRTFVGMRYFPADMLAAAGAIRESGASSVVLLPLFPQASDTTTTTCVHAAREALAKAGFVGKISAVRHFFDDPGFQGALLDLIATTRAEAPADSRIIFTAHSLPVKLAVRDSYYDQVKSTVTMLGEKLSIPVALTRASAEAWQDAILAFQSKVGPMKWLEPSVEQVIEEWGRGGCGSVVVVPVSFVSEHSETLYELDILYRKAALANGMEFHRVPAVGCHPLFIECLAGAVKRIKYE